MKITNDETKPDLNKFNLLRNIKVMTSSTKTIKFAAFFQFPFVAHEPNDSDDEKIKKIQRSDHQNTAELLMDYRAEKDPNRNFLKYPIQKNENWIKPTAKDAEIMIRNIKLVTFYLRETDIET